MEFRLKVVKSSNRTDIVFIFSDDEGANVFLGFCFLVVVITIDMCCAYVRRRIFNEMQQPSKCNETRSSFFSLFFYFFMLFFFSSRSLIEFPIGNESRSIRLLLQHQHQACEGAFG
jgi:ABC-type multidrug transport system fused ATPase/permease subunit